MVRIVMEVEGMACGMCESHVNDAVRKAFRVKKVTSSRAKGRTEIIAEASLDAEALKAAVSSAGYAVGEIRAEPYEKKGFSLFRR